MRKLSHLLLFVWTGWPAIVQAETQAAPVGLRVQVCARSQGLPDSDIQAFRERLRQELVDLGVKAFAPAGGVPAGGCATQKHLRLARAGRACGVIDLQVLRFGPVVHIDVRVLHAVVGKEILHLKARAAAERFPGGTSLAPVLEKVVARLRKVNRRETDIRVSGSPDDEIPALPPEFVVLDEGLPEIGAEFGAPAASDSTWSWVGGGLLVAGGVLCTVGAVYLAGPFQDALDARADAYRSYHQRDVAPGVRALYQAALERKNDEANRALSVGWAGTAAGVALLAGGTVALTLDAERDDGATAWLGGGLAAGGAVLAGAGIYLLAGPARDALDRRDAAVRVIHEGSADQDVAAVASEVAAQDRRAFENDALGWVLASSGAVLLAGGAALLWAGAADDPDVAGPPVPAARVRPVLLPGGGGVFFQLRW